MEGAGTVEVVGAEVTTCKPGDRVVYSGMPARRTRGVSVLVP
jgi:Zn-dependent alcohol dehydrogenase